MPRRVFEQFDYPIDEDLDNWRTNVYDTDPRQAISGPIGVLHNVPVDIGGVVVKQHIFVVEHSNSDLLLGRPWERASRAQCINEDDGSYMW
jgi:hypothetical protein